MSMADESEVWQASLHGMVRAARSFKSTSETKSEYTRWTEIYYQITLAVFPKNHVPTPYKLKLCLIPSLMNEPEAFQKPWDHMTELLQNRTTDLKRIFT